jgi:hypothetical protein
LFETAHPAHMVIAARNAKECMLMVTASEIKEHMPVVCSNNGQFGEVDHVDKGNSIKLTKDKAGQHHWIPMNWVTKVDDKVHVDRPGEQAMREWMSTPPEARAQM